MRPHNHNSRRVVPLRSLVLLVCGAVASLLLLLASNYAQGVVPKSLHRSQPTRLINGEADEVAVSDRLSGGAVERVDAPRQPSALQAASLKAAQRGEAANPAVPVHSAAASIQHQQADATATLIGKAQPVEQKMADAQPSSAAVDARQFDAVRPALLHGKRTAAPGAAAQAKPAAVPAQQQQQQPLVTKVATGAAGPVQSVFNDPVEPTAAAATVAGPLHRFDPVRPSLLRRHHIREARRAATNKPSAVLTARNAGLAPLPTVAASKPTTAAVTAVAPQSTIRAVLREDKFTLMALSHSKRMPSLKVYVAHYRNCSEVEEIVVVWNGVGSAAADAELAALVNGSSAVVPVRVRQEASNSLNNRFRPDPLLRTRAVLQLDDDVILRCEDLSRGFAAWRRHPDRLVGYFPREVRLPANGAKPQYVPDVFDTAHGGTHTYNILLTKGAFQDAQQAYPAYWSDKYAEARAMVDAHFNCEDILMNFVWAAESHLPQPPAGTSGGLMHTTAGRASQPARWLGALNNRLKTAFAYGLHPDVSAESTPPVLLYVSPRCFLETGLLSGNGISSKPRHLEQRAACAQRFAAMLGGPPRSQALGLGERKPEEQWAQEKEVWSTTPSNATAERMLGDLCAWGGY